MGRLLAIDYGSKRTGIAVTDPLRIIATALDTITSDNVITFLKAYCSKEVVDEFVIGMPKNLKNEDSENAPRIREFIVVLKNAFPGKNVIEVDERFTSSIAKQTMHHAGLKKKSKRDKTMVDKISATLILQNFLNSR